MNSLLLSGEEDVQAIRGFINRLSPNSTIVDFEENILLSSFRAATRIWKQNGVVIGFASIDDFNNLWFDVDSTFDDLDQLESEIIDWGITCIRQRNTKNGSQNPLDCTCGNDNFHRIQVLETHDFIRSPVRTLHYSRSLQTPIIEYPLPEGFSIRCVTGPNEVVQLVALHRAAFGTDNMTVEGRLAIMSVPQYTRELDLVAVAPNHDLAAFCICGFSDPGMKTGYTDPIGTHPQYQRLGLAKSLVSTGLIALKKGGATGVTMGTSSENSALQKLAAELGFVCVSEQLWFSKTVH